MSRFFFLYILQCINFCVFWVGEVSFSSTKGNCLFLFSGKEKFHSRELNISIVSVFFWANKKEGNETDVLVFRNKEKETKVLLPVLGANENIRLFLLTAGHGASSQ